MASKSLNNLLDIWKHSKPRNKLAFSLISILSVVSGILETLVILSFVLGLKQGLLDWMVIKFKESRNKNAQNK